MVVMQSWEILRMIPRGSARDLAARFGRSEDLVRRWAREPPSEGDERATGAQNPIDRLDTLFDFLLEACPEAAELIADRYQAKLSRGGGRAARDWEAAIRAMIRETSDAVATVAVGAPGAEVEREVGEAIAALREVLTHVSAASSQASGARGEEKQSGHGIGSGSGFQGT